VNEFRGHASGGLFAGILFFAVNGTSFFKDQNAKIKI
jgi:hypothetical protein